MMETPNRRAYRQYGLSLWKYDKNGKPRYFSTLPKWGTNNYYEVQSMRRILDKVMGDIFEIRISDALD